MIVFDVDNEDDGGEYTRRSARTQRLAHKGYLAKQMWEGYKEWLDHHPKELEIFKRFEVRIFITVMLDISIVLDNLSNCMLSFTMPIAARKKHFPDLYPAQGDEEYFCVRHKVMREGFVVPLLDPSAEEKGEKVYRLNRMGGVTVLLPAFERS